MAQRRRKPSKAQIKNRRSGNSERVPMLNIRYARSFEYDLREILKDSEMKEDYVNVFIANLITKGSRNSLREAKEYVQDLAKDEAVDSSSAERICALLDRNRKYR